jgi:hypothetical protein
LLLTTTVQALQDWDYISRCALKGRLKDPFFLTTKRTSDFKLLKELLNLEQERATDTRDSDFYWVSKLEEDIKVLDNLPPPKDQGNEETVFGSSRIASNSEDRYERGLKRLYMAALGGIFLIGPMLIMVLHKSLLTTLLTTSLCVVIFGLLMVRYGEAPFDVLSGTAAYAAVLVVFVGASS